MDAIYESKYIRDTVKFMKDICDKENAESVTLHINLKGELSLRILEKLSIKIESSDFTVPVSQAKIYIISTGALSDFIYRINTDYVRITVNKDNIIFTESDVHDLDAIEFGIPGKMLIANAIN